MLCNMFFFCIQDTVKKMVKRKPEKRKKNIHKTNKWNKRCEQPHIFICASLFMHGKFYTDCVSIISHYFYLFSFVTHLNTATVFISSNQDMVCVCVFFFCFCFWFNDSFLAFLLLIVSFPSNTLHVFIEILLWALLIWIKSSCLSLYSVSIFFSVVILHDMVDLFQLSFSFLWKSFFWGISVSWSIFVFWYNESLNNSIWIEWEK